MNILLYIPNISKASGGVYQYTKCLLSILQRDQKNKYFLFLRGNHSEFKEFNDVPNFTFLTPSETDYRSSLFSLFERLTFNIAALLSKLKIHVTRTSVIDKVIERYRIDLLHSPSQSLPVTDIPKIFTLHDLQELHFPEFFTPEERAARASGYQYSVYNASKIIASYEHIKSDIINHFNIEANKVEVVLLNMNNLWFEKFKDNTPALKSTVALPPVFLFYPAATWKHKNHANLFKAIKRLKERDIIIHLVCSGEQTGHYKELNDLIDALGIGDQICFLGKISDEDLYYVYKNCLAVIIPTLYEAGSFPLMEAMLIGIPCVCSNVTSLPGTLNQSAYVFDPLDIEDIADKASRIYLDNEYREREVQQYKTQIKSLTGTDSLDIFYYIYEGVLNNYTKNKKEKNENA